MAFDIYDVNNDNHVSEGDLFRLFKMCEGEQMGETFERAFQKDVLVMIKFIEAKKQAKQQIEKNNSSLKYNTAQEEPHAKYFRKANVADADFDAKKRKIFKALFQIKKELQKKKEQKVQNVTKILRTNSGIDDK